MSAIKGVQVHNLNIFISEESILINVGIPDKFFDILEKSKKLLDEESTIFVDHKF